MKTLIALAAVLCLALGFEVGYQLAKLGPAPIVEWTTVVTPAVAP